MRFSFGRTVIELFFIASLLLTLAACSTSAKVDAGNNPPSIFKTSHQVLVISVPEQKMLFIDHGKVLETYPISTAKNGIGDIPNSYKTPAGTMEIAEKFGDGLAPGSVLKDRQPTGEVIPVEAPGRDPIVSRVLWLRGLEERNRNAYERFIYIHGTPQESLLGTPASFGCIRMRSVDIIRLYDLIELGAKVVVSEETLDATKEYWVKKTTSLSSDQSSVSNLAY